MCPLSNTCVYIYISAKFTLNSKRFPRLKSTFPPLIKSSVLASLHSKRISALVPFLSRPQAIRTSPLPPFGLNFFELSLSSLQQRSGLQRLGDAEKTFQGLKGFSCFRDASFTSGFAGARFPPNSTPEKRSCSSSTKIPRYTSSFSNFRILSRYLGKVNKNYWPKISGFPRVLISISW